MQSVSSSQQPFSNTTRQGLRQWGIGQKIGLGYATILGIMVAGSTIGNVIGNFYTHRAQIYEEDAIGETVELYQFRTALAEIKLGLHRLQQYPQNTPQFRAEYLRLQSNAEQFQQGWSTFKKEYQEKQEAGFEESDQELQFYQAILETHDRDVTSYINQLTALSLGLKESYTNNDLARLQTQLIAIQQLSLLRNFSEDLEELINLIALEELEQAKADLKTASIIRNYVTASSILLSVLIAVLFAVHFSRLISRPIQTVTHIAQRITNETNFELQAPAENNDEIGTLAITLNLLVKRVKELLQENEERNRSLAQTNEKLVSTRTQMIAQEKLASLGSLTAGIAHEIKNPLNFVNNFSELSIDLVDELTATLNSIKAQLEPELVDEIVEVMELLKINVSKIEHHGKRADKIVANMLMQSRHGKGEWTNVNINEIVSEAVHFAYHGMRSKYPKFNLEWDHNYDQSLSTIYASEQDLSRVFLNIANNACYAIYQKQRIQGPSFKPRLKLRTRNLDNEIEIYFRDNGIGMSPAVKDQIFNQFFTTKPTGEGTGLGLSLSYSIVVEQHQGSIDVVSEEGHYTDFIVTLPKKL